MCEYYYPYYKIKIEINDLYIFFLNLCHETNYVPSREIWKFYTIRKEFIS